MGEELVVYVPFPMLHPSIDLDRLRKIHPDVEVVTTPFDVDHELRTMRVLVLVKATEDSEKGWTREKLSGN